MPTPRKPRSVLALTGNLNPRRHGTKEQIFSLPAGVPAPPEWLANEALEEWLRICASPVMQQVLSPLDDGILLAHCVAYQELVWRATGVREGGVRSCDIAALAATSQKLGLSPADRAKLMLPETKKEENHWTRFLGPN